MCARIKGKAITRKDSKERDGDEKRTAVADPLFPRLNAVTSGREEMNVAPKKRERKDSMEGGPTTPQVPHVGIPTAGSVNL